MRKAGSIWRQIRLRESPPPRAAHSGDLIAPGLVIFWGGWNGAEALGELNLFELKSSRWHKLETANTPGRRNNHASATVDGILYLHGGHNGMQWLHDLHAIDLKPAIDAISAGKCAPILEWYEPEVDGPRPHARACHTLTHVNGALILYGGYDGLQCYRDMDVLDLKTFKWSVMNLRSGSVLPEGRNAHSMTLVGQKLYMFGGHAGHHHMGDLHTFDLRERVWTEVATFGDCPASPRGHGAAYSGGRLIIFGGMSQKNRNQVVYSYDLVNQEWHVHKTSLEPGAPEARQRHTFTALNDKEVLLFGGFNGMNWLSDMHLLNVQNLLYSSLKYDQPIVGAMTDLFNSEKFADVKIITADEPILAHKCILYAHSPYFRLAISKMARSTDQGETALLSLARWEGHLVRGLIFYIYTGLVEPREPEFALQLLQLADYVAMDNLVCDCKKVIECHVLGGGYGDSVFAQDLISKLRPKSLQVQLGECIKQASYKWTADADETYNEHMLTLPDAVTPNGDDGAIGADLSIPLPQGAGRGSSSHFLFLRSAAFLGSSMFTNFC